MNDLDGRCRAVITLSATPSNPAFIWAGEVVSNRACGQVQGGVQPVRPWRRVWSSATTDVNGLDTASSLCTAPGGAP